MQSSTMIDGRQRGSLTRLALAGLACVAWATACGDGAVEPSPPPPPPPDPVRPTSVTVEPSSATLTSLGETVVFRATVNDQRGGTFPGTVTWSSSDETVVTVNAGGTATAVANGSGTVTATFQSLSATAAVEVAQALAALETVSGDGQAARVGAALPDSVVVRAVDAGGSPIEGVTVVFAAGEGHGAADPAEAVTDTAGLARTLWTLGDAPGAQTLAASVADGPSAAIAARGLTATEVVHAIEVVSGGGQTADLGAALDDSVVVRAVDAEGAPVEGAAVAFTPGDGHGTADPAETFTDSEGLARTLWTLGKDVGEQTLVAAVGDVSETILAQTINPDRAALVALYEATNGPNWVNNENWLTDAPLEDWYGVDTDGTGRVVTLNLRSRWEYPQWIPHGLSGPIPPELGNLTHLRALFLSGNALSGPIPPELGNLTRLVSLYLEGTPLSGPIPAELGNLINLRNVYLPRGVCVPDDLRAWAIETGISVSPCTVQGRLLPSALMREDGNGLSLALPDDLREPSAVTVSDSSVVTVSVADGWLELVPRSRGSADVEVAPPDGGAPASARVVVRAAVGTFGIDIVMERPAPVTYEKALMTAADWWSSVLNGTEWPDRRPTCLNDQATAVADELLIHAKTDKDIRAAGRAYTCFRPPGEQTALDPGGGGVVANPENANPYLVQHEMGHLLGLVLWGPETGLVTEDGAYFVGPQAVEAFRASGGDPDLPGVPFGGTHWGPGVKDIMSAEGGGESRISVASLADAGYTVDMTKATPLSATLGASTGDVSATAPAGDHANDAEPIEPSRHPREGSSDGLRPH